MVWWRNLCLALRQAEAWMGGYDEVWTNILKMENHPAVASSMGYSGNLSGPEKCTEFRYAKCIFCRNVGSD